MYSGVRDWRSVPREGYKEQRDALLCWVPCEAFGLVHFPGQPQQLQGHVTSGIGRITK